MQARLLGSLFLCCLSLTNCTAKSSSPTDGEAPPNDLPAPQQQMMDTPALPTPPTIIISPATLPQLVYGQAFEIDISSTVPGTIEMTGLPPGLALTTLNDQSARVSGIPSRAGTFAVEAKVSAVGRSATISYSVTVVRAQWLLVHAAQSETPGPVFAFDLTSPTLAASPVLSNIHVERPPVWSPNGSAFSAITYDSGSSVYEVLYTSMVGGAQANPTIANVYGVFPNATVGDAQPIDSVYWSPDGKRFVYFVEQTLAPTTDQGATLYLVDCTNGAPSAPVKIGQPVNGTTITSAIWSPDSTHVGYIANEEGSSPAKHLYVVNVTPGTSPVRKRVTPDLPDTAEVFQFEWAPSSTVLAYHVDDTTDGETHVWTARSLDATVENTQVSAAGKTAAIASFSADGAMLAYTETAAANSADLWVATVSMVPYTSMRVSQDLSSTQSVGEAHWSKSGILFAVLDSTPSNVKRYHFAGLPFVSAPATTPAVTDARTFVSATVTSDGKHVVAHDGVSVFQRPLADLASHFDIDTGMNALDTVLVSSPDGKRFAYREPVALDESQKLFTFEQGGPTAAWVTHQVNTQTPALLGHVSAMTFGSESASIAFRQDDSVAAHLYVTELLGDSAFMSRELTSVELLSVATFVFQPTPR